MIKRFGKLFKVMSKDGKKAYQHILDQDPWFSDAEIVT